MNATFHFLLFIVIICCSFPFWLYFDWNKCLSTEWIWINRFGVRISMVDTKFSWSILRDSFVIANSASSWIPFTSTTSPTLRPQTSLWSKLVYYRMVLAIFLNLRLILVRILNVVLSLASPISAFHSSILLQLSFLSKWRLYLNNNRFFSLRMHPWFNI
jgi:hypothetical protein